MSERIHVVFVCLGNICRSPVAEAAFRAVVREAGLEDAFVIASAGTGDWHVGAPADPRTVRTAEARGVDLSSHRARQFTARDFARFDHVVAMDRANVRTLSDMARADEDRAKIVLMRSACVGVEPDAEVPDPYYGDQTGFDTVMELCEVASRALLDALLTQHPHARERARLGR